MKKRRSRPSTRLRSLDKLRDIRDEITHLNSLASGPKMASDRFMHRMAVGREEEEDISEKIRRETRHRIKLTNEDRHVLPDLDFVHLLTVPTHHWRRERDGVDVLGRDSNSRCDRSVKSKSFSNNCVEVGKSAELIAAKRKRLTEKSGSKRRLRGREERRGEEGKGDGKLTRRELIRKQQEALLATSSAPQGTRQAREGSK